MDVNHLGDRVTSDWDSVSSSANILLVDSNPVSLVHTASLLQEKVYNVTMAGSAGTALKLFKARKEFYHIVMADYYLQDMNIFEFMGRIKDQCLTPIFLMAHDHNKDLAKDALRKGASFFIQKPLLPSDLARLLYHIFWITGTVPGATSRKQKKRKLINSEDGNRKPRKSRTAQGPSHFQSLPSNPSTTPPSTNFVGFTLEGVQQKLHEISGVSNQDTTGHLARGVYRNGNVITNVGSDQLGGETGGGQIFLESSVMGSLQVSNQEARVDLGREMHCNGNGIIMNTGSRQVAGQIFMGGGQVTSTYGGYLTDTLHVPNQEASSNLVRGVYGHENVNNTGRDQVGSEIGGDQILVEGDEMTLTYGCVTGTLHVPNQDTLPGLGGRVNSTENFIRNTRSHQIVEEIARAQILLEGGQVGWEIAEGQVGSEFGGGQILVEGGQVGWEIAEGGVGSEFGGGRKLVEEGQVGWEIGEGQVGSEFGGGQVLVEGGQVMTQTNGCITGALDVSNQEASPDLGGGIYSEIGQITAEETAGAQTFFEGGYQNTGATSPSARAQAQITDDDINEWLSMVYEEVTNPTVEPNSTT